MADKTRAQILGENLKRIREEKGVTRKMLAEATGIAVDSIIAYENGKNLVPLDKIFSFADFFNISILDLTGDTQFGEIAKIIQRRLSRAEGIAAASGFSMARLDDGRIMLIAPSKKRKNADGTFTVVLDRCYTFTDASEFIEFAEFAEAQYRYYEEDKENILFKPTFDKLIRQKFQKLKE